MPEIGPTEIILLLAVALLLFGAKRLPEIGRTAGKGLREFKDSVSGITDAHKELKEATDLTGSKKPSEHDTTS
ncbi:MAG TPA: twin-arginine translocase TatA/TatE family subunit [Gaiellaceae bacterium]|nr:twin-arginine translocase TatA/TatE family subunit [Gaiellaceae bacterium]